jgi:hypothetical protein
VSAIFVLDLFPLFSRAIYITRLSITHMFFCKGVVMIEKSGLKILLGMVLCSSAGFAQNTFIGINAGHTLVVNLVSQNLGDETRYLPIHLQVNHAFSDHFGLSAGFLYRLDKDGNFATNEIGAAIGPCYMQKRLNGFIGDVKIGFARAFGRNYDLEDYSRTDFLLQPEMGYFVRMGDKFSFCFGIGVQSLLMISESPSRANIWDWNGMGKFSHYYLPVLNISIGFMP